MRSRWSVINKSPLKLTDAINRVNLLYSGRLHSLPGAAGAEQQIRTADGRLRRVARPTTGGPPRADPARDPKRTQDQRSVLSSSAFLLPLPFPFDVMQLFFLLINLLIYSIFLSFNLLWICRRMSSHGFVRSSWLNAKVGTSKVRGQRSQGKANSIWILLILFSRGGGGGGQSWERERGGVSVACG